MRGGSEVERGQVESDMFLGRVPSLKGTGV